MKTYKPTCLFALNPWDQVVQLYKCEKTGDHIWAKLQPISSVTKETIDKAKCL